MKNANAKANLSGDTGGQAVRQFPVMALLTSVRRAFKFSLSGCRRQPVGINNICIIEGHHFFQKNLLLSFHYESFINRDKHKEITSVFLTATQAKSCSIASLKLVTRIND